VFSLGGHGSADSRVKRATTMWIARPLSLTTNVSRVASLVKTDSIAETAHVAGGKIVRVGAQRVNFPKRSGQFPHFHVLRGAASFQRRYVRKRLAGSLAIGKPVINKSPLFRTRALAIDGDSGATAEQRAA